MRSVSLSAAAFLVLAMSAGYGCSGTAGTFDPGADQGISGDGTGDTDGSAGNGSGNGGGGGDDGGTASGDDGGAAGDDASTGGGDGAVAHDAAGSDAAVTDAGACIKAVTSPGSGHHNAGKDCATCHDSLSASRRWTVAGTLYNAATGGSAVSGATIEVIDANGKKLDLPTYDNGNFYTTTSVAFPLTVRASKCPADLKMTNKASGGSCNNCHNSTMRIHAP